MKQPMYITNELKLVSQGIKMWIIWIKWYVYVLLTLSRAAILKRYETAKHEYWELCWKTLFIDQGNKNNKYCTMLSVTSVHKQFTSFILDFFFFKYLWTARFEGLTAVLMNIQGLWDW
jgi:hypothetical protein